MDSDSVRSATRSELNTFQVLANTEFANLQKPAPTSWGGRVIPEEVEAVEPEKQLEVPLDQHDVVPEVQREEIREDYDLAEKERSPSVARSARSVHSVHTEVFEVKKDEKHQYSTRAKEEAAVDVAIEKESLLYELDMMEKQGSIKLHRQLTMADSLESIQYQYDRANMIISTQQTVEWAKTGIKMGSGLLETVVKKFGLSVVDGFSNNLCKDMNKFNQPLTKIYRKYWRRGSSSPESEMAMIVFGALAMTVMNNKGLMGGAKPEPFARPQAPPSEPSALRPPGSFTGQQISEARTETKPESRPDSRPESRPEARPGIPEWAKAALSAPVPEKPKHFAQTAQTAQQSATQQPEELSINVPTTFLPKFQEIDKVDTKKIVEDESKDATKRLTILGSPKTGRRRNHASEDLVFN